MLYTREPHKIREFFNSNSEVQEWHNKFKVLKENNLPTKNTIPSKVVCQKRRNSFSDKRNPKFSKNIYENINLIGKVKYIVKFRII